MKRMLISVSGLVLMATLANVSVRAAPFPGPDNWEAALQTVGIDVVTRDAGHYDDSVADFDLQTGGQTAAPGSLPNERVQTKGTGPTAGAADNQGWPAVWGRGRSSKVRLPVSAWLLAAAVVGLAAVARRGNYRGR